MKYIIINKTAIQKRIEKLEKEIDDKKIDVEVQRLIKHELKQILSNSAPLIPEIEKSFDAGSERDEYGYGNANDKQDYISNLKLDI